MSAVVSVHVSWLSVSGMTVALLPVVGFFTKMNTI